MLTIYNTLTRRKEEFRPIHAPKVGMYVCGMTIYDYCHVGHARMMMAFDVVQRWLRASGYQVTYVQNITDIDDKIIKRAVENGETITALTTRMTAAMMDDLAQLGIQKPDVMPRATEYVPQMLAMIGTLEEKGIAYHATSADGAAGDVNYAVRKFPGYGKLSGKSLDELRAGERIAVDTSKQDPLDFVLWKSAKPDEPPEAKWPSKWGPGRPGWHIECSAMSCAILGEHFDIHGGGTDLQFPHHENEIAQTEAATGKTFVNYWLHNGFLNVDNEKMSKSLGNFFTIRDVLKHYDPEVVRYFLVRTHYRSPVNYGDKNMDDAKGALTRLYTTLKNVPPDAQPLDWNEPHAQRFKAAMDDDFNTPEAVAVLFELASEVNRSQSARLAGQLKGLGRVLAVLQREPVAFLQGRVVGSAVATNSADSSSAHGFVGLSNEQIEALKDARTTAKAAKNFAEADRIRKQLLDQGIVLEDKPGGKTEWRRA
ncbi:MAG: cysteinyl-tRNA synthetase [Pseudomonadota bacterium]|jgi:cysteinyl-tRNA synthetase